jgi:hypothetical protein
MCRGKTGGAYGMNLFSDNGLYDNRSVSEINAYHNARDPGELSYNINPNLWCSDLLPQLTCCSIHKDDCGTGGGGSGQAWRHRYGTVAITKRHVLGCAHAFSHAQGTWISGNINNIPPTRLRFIDKNGSSIDRIQLHQAIDPLGADLHVAVLDQDLPDSIYIPRVAPSNYINELNGYQSLIFSQEFQPQSRSDAYGTHYASWLYQRNVFPFHGIYYDAIEPGDAGVGIIINHVVVGTGNDINISVSSRTITITHGSSANTDSIISAINASNSAKVLVSVRRWGLNSIVNRTLSGSLGGLLTPLSNYPLLNRAMFHVAGMPNFMYHMWKGDSGTPQFTVLDGEVIISGIISGDVSNNYPKGGTTWPQRLNGMIAAADANAISIGRMTAPTGYTVTPYTGRIL